MALTQPSSEYNDHDVLRTCLQLLGDEASKDEQRTAMETMLKLCKNIRDHPGEEKYLKIRKENKAIHDKLLRFDGAKEFLLAMGWTEVEDVLMFLDGYDISIAISILEEYISTLPAPANASSSKLSTTSSGDGSIWTDEELKLKEKKMEEEKKKRMEEYKRLKREREKIKKQIKDDRKDTNTKEVKDSHARHLNSGVFKKFENQGGG